MICKAINVVVNAICISLVGGLMLVGIETIARAIDCKEEKPALIQPPNYDKESLLELLKKGECVGGTIDEGQFSVFVCKE